MKVSWDETNPDTGEHRYYKAELFGGQWTFRRRDFRRDDWHKIRNPTRTMWTEVYEFLERACARQLATHEQLSAIKKILAELPPEDPG